MNLFKIIILTGLTLNAFSAGLKYKQFINNKSLLNVDIFKKVSSSLVTVTNSHDAIKQRIKSIIKLSKKNKVTSYRVYEKETNVNKEILDKEIAYLSEQIKSSNKNYIWEKVGTKTSESMIVLLVRNKLTDLNNALNIINNIDDIPIRSSVRIIFSSLEFFSNIEFEAHLKKYKEEYKNRNILSVVDIGLLESSKKTQLIQITNNFKQAPSNFQKNTQKELSKHKFTYETLKTLSEENNCNYFVNEDIPCFSIEYGSTGIQSDTKFVNFIVSLCNKQ